MIGVIDIPQESRRDHLQLDLNSGHLAIIGAPGSGKTMLLRTMLLNLALRHSPQDLWCYLIDAGGHGLSLFTGLPHVGGLIQVGDRERIRRLFWMIDNELRERQERFRSVGASDLQIYRANSGERLPAIVVMLDKFALLREELQDDIDQLVRFARTGRAYGVHFVVTADRTSDIGYKLLSLLEHRISLRMPDLYDYSEILGGRVSSQIPADIPGRGFRTYFDQGILEIQLALPSLERSSTNSETDPEDGGESAAALDAEINSDLREHVAKLNDIWQQSFSDSNSPQAVELLRDYVALEAFLNGSGKSLGPDDDLELPLGIEDLRLCQSKVRLGVDAPHMLVLGGRRSGKTTTMLTMLIGLADQYSAEDLRFLIVDIRGRGLRPLRDLPHTERYAVHEDEVQELATYLRRIKRQDVEPCRRVVVVDDFDLGAGTLMKSQFIQDYDNNDNLFGALTTLAATGGDIGMHLILAGNIDFISGSPGPLKTLNDAGNGLVLRPNTYVSGTELLGLRLPIGQRDTEMPSGRAVLVVEGDQQVIQIASLPDADLPAQIARLVERATAGVLEP
jgi:DNA segregation ATPase FtsK/SpoIIIE, S-DNA-T family